MDPRHVSSLDQLDALLADGKITEEEYRDLWNALKGRGAAGQQEGAASREAAAKVPLSGREIAVMLVCAFFQIAGLIGAIVVNPILLAIGGLASIIAYVVTPREWRFVKRLALIAAIAGACEIVLTVLGLA